MPDDNTPPAAPKLLDRVRNVIRLKHYSLRTEQSYVHWVKRFIYFHGKRHPGGMGKPEVTAFLSHLAVERDVAAATQNQALERFGYSRAQEQESLVQVGDVLGPRFERDIQNRLAKDLAVLFLPRSDRR